MGSCVSVHKDPDSATGYRLAMGSRAAAKKVFAPPPGAQNGENPTVGEFDPMCKPVDSGLGFRSPGFGSKEEAFFDSQAWLESDCEDDFFSVNGEFTPSRGSTPNYQAGTPMTPRLNKAAFFEGFPDTKSEPSPRKKLADFFHETLGDEHNAAEGKVEVDGKPEFYKTSNDQQPPKSSDGTPYLSGTNSICSDERTPNADFKNGKEKRGKAMHCCLPSLIHSRSFNERKKRTPSPG